MTWLKKRRRQPGLRKENLGKVQPSNLSVDSKANPGWFQWRLHVVTLNVPKGADLERETGKLYLFKLQFQTPAMQDLHYPTATHQSVQQHPPRFVPYTVLGSHFGGRRRLGTLWILQRWPRRPLEFPANVNGWWWKAPQSHS